MDKVLEDMNKCYGCTACMNTCPVHAISMQENDEGFMMPVIDKDKCTDCGACRKVCPVMNAKFDNEAAPSVYGAAAGKDVLKDSSSGGAFTMLAEEMFKRNGTVFGAAYTDDFHVHHIPVTNEQDLDLIRRSKYVQSDQEDCYSKAKAILDDGGSVLYSGCPCQIAGLRCFLGKDYPKLITCELICHGIPSPKFHIKHLRGLAGYEKVSSVEMRSRKEWRTCYTVTTESGDVISSKGAKDLYIKAFLSHLIMRRSCHGCAFARLPRQADITIGDLWDAKRLGLGLPYEKKSSIILLNNDKGRGYWDTVMKSIPKNVAVTDLSSVDIKSLNHNISVPSADEDMTVRDRFYENIKSMGFEEAVIKTLYDFDTGLLLHMGNNYGSVATGYALYKAIENMGMRPVMLDSLVPPKGQLGKNFVKKHMEYSSHYFEDGDYKAADILCDNFVLGSDQSLNWEFRHNMKHLEYLLMSFTSPEKRRISYAASFGDDRDHLDDQNLRKAYSTLLARFDSFSVREHFAPQMSERLFDRKADVTADPVFLLDKEDWESIASQGKKPSPGYLLAYILEQSPEKERLVKAQAEKYGLRPVIISDASAYRTKGQDDSLEDWLSMFWNADRIITDSFHGSCFALIFGKPFVTIKARQTDRFDTLAAMLTEGGIDGASLFLDQNQEIDPNGEYFNITDTDKIEELIHDYAEKSKAWLRNALTSEKTESGETDTGSKTGESDKSGVSGKTGRHAEASALPPDHLVNYVRLLKEEMSLSKILTESSILSWKGIRIDVEQEDDGNPPSLPEYLSAKSDASPLRKKGNKGKQTGFTVLPRDGTSCEFTFEKPGGGNYTVRIASRGLRDMDGELHPALIQCTRVTAGGKELLPKPCFVSSDDPKEFTLHAHDKKQITLHIEWSDEVSVRNDQKKGKNMLKKLFHRK